MTQMLKSLNKIEQDKYKENLRNSTDIENTKDLKTRKTMDFLFIKRLLYIKHEIDENPFESSIDSSFGRNEYFEEKPRTKTPKSLITGRKHSKHPIRIESRLLSGSNSGVEQVKERVKTTIHRQRRHEYSSMSPLKLFEKTKKQNVNNVSVDLK